MQDIHIFQRDGITLGIDGETLLVFALERGDEIDHEALKKARSRNSKETKPEIRLERMSSQTLHVSSLCPCRCRYCLAEDGSYGEPKGVMPVEIARAAIDWFIEVSKEERISLVFFGGEPCCAPRVIEEAVDYGEKICNSTGRRIEYSMTTGATMLDGRLIRIFESIGDRMRILISIDGSREIQDHLRPFANGAGTYQTVIDNVEDLHRAGIKLGARSTMTSANCDPKEIYDFLKSLKYFRFINMIPVEDLPWGDSTLAIDREALLIMKRGLRDMAGECISGLEQGESDFQFKVLMDLVSQIARRQKKGRPCGAVMKGVSVSTCGDIYPCHRFVGREEFRMGNVLEKPRSWPESIIQRFADPVVNQCAECRKCWARRICAGRCFSEMYRNKSGMSRDTSVHCEWTRELIENAVHILYRATLLRGNEKCGSSRE